MAEKKTNKTMDKITEKITPVSKPKTSPPVKVDTTLQKENIQRHIDNIDKQIKTLQAQKIHLETVKNKL
jgi:hypothetical protein